MAKLIRNVVGKKVYVWSSSNGGPSRNSCVISAHGDTSFMNGMSSAPDCQLVYYSEHGHMVNDPGLEAVIAATIKSKETINSRQSQDYNLSKYTNTNKDRTQHNKRGETYGTVGALAELFDQKHGNAAGFLAMADLPAKNVAEQTFYEKQYRRLSMDIVTIRDRNFHTNPKLSEVLKDLWKAGYLYTTVHCCFCRGGGAAQTPEKVTF